MAGLSSRDYLMYALDVLCKFNAPNVLEFGVGKRMKDILPTLRKYLLVFVWSQENKQELRKSELTLGKKLKKKEQIQHKKKKKRQADTFRVAQGVKPKLETQVQSQSRLLKARQLIKKVNNTGNQKAKESVVESMKASPQLPLICGQCQKEYKNVRSYSTHMYLVPIKRVPEGSSHNLQGNPQVRVVPCKINPSTEPDQFMLPRQDKKVPPSRPSQKDSERIETKLQGNTVHSRKDDTNAVGDLPSVPPKGSRRQGK